MADSFGPRTFFVGQVLCGMAAHGDIITDADIEYAIQVADKTMDKMTWPNGKPEKLMMGEWRGANGVAGSAGDLGIE